MRYNTETAYQIPRPLYVIINTTAKWPPNTPLEKYRDLLPDRWKPRKSL